MMKQANHALQQNRPLRSGCNRGVPRAGSLSLGRSRDMKRLIHLLSLMLVFSVNLEANFGIADLSDWSQLEKNGIELKYHPGKETSGDEPLDYYRFTLLIPMVCKDLPGKILHRIDYWKDGRSTEIPIESREVGMGMRMASFQISVADLKNASVVLRFGEPNSSAETGWRLPLWKLIEARKSNP